ncbi:MAG: GntP family permease, partial [Turicibacter sp.]|nr:GntP family permease [Turicibacter sp.]
VNILLDGARGMIPAVIRIITAGVLAGVLIQTGAAATIAAKIIKVIGEKGALIALALSVMLLTGVGVFIDVAVITVAPIALMTAKKVKLPTMAVLLAMIGGGKAGNMLSPNPNTIATAENFGVELQSLMVANIVPAIAGLIMTIILAKYLAKKYAGEEVAIESTDSPKQDLPKFWAAIVGPVVTIILLALRPMFDLAVDPLIALPVGGIIGCLAMGKIRHLNDYMNFGLGKMMPITILLLGTGAISGIIAASGLRNDTIVLLEAMHLPMFLLAPISGILMSAATASTTAGANLASATFGGAIVGGGVSAIAGAAMVHTGATVLDHLPHGSFFHATGGSVYMDITKRLKVVPYESLVGIVMTIVSTIIWGML